MYWACAGKRGHFNDRAMYWACAGKRGYLMIEQCTEHVQVKEGILMIEQCTGHVQVKEGILMIEQCTGHVQVKGHLECVVLFYIVLVNTWLVTKLLNLSFKCVQRYLFYLCHTKWYIIIRFSACEGSSSGCASFIFQWFFFGVCVGVWSWVGFQ